MGQYLKSTLATLKVWNRLLISIKQKLVQYDVDEIGDDGSEQIMLDTFIRQEKDLKLMWLDPFRFVSGVYYSDANYRKNATSPCVILNNWIHGNSPKIERA